MNTNVKSGSLVKWAVTALAVILLPLVLPNSYFIRVLDLVGIYILLSTGSNILTGFAGQLSMGQAAFYGVGAYTTGLIGM